MLKKRHLRRRVIVISDSDEDEIKRPRKATENRDECGNGREVETRLRWPTDSASNTNPSSIENLAPNTNAKDATTSCSANGSSTSGIRSDIGSSVDAGRCDRSYFIGRHKTWTIPELLAETQNINQQAAKNIVQLFENENTIPFICRYRRDLVNHVTPERLRDIKTKYMELVELRKRAITIVTRLEKNPTVDEQTRFQLLNATNNEELEFLYAPYKPTSKASLAERAKSLGLSVHAERLLYGEVPEVCLATIVEKANPELNTVEKVMTGICHIISDIIRKHTKVLEELRRLQKRHSIKLQSTATKARSNSSTKASTSKISKADEQSKFKNYFDYNADVRMLKPHQVLAINRGEKQKFLTVRLIVPDALKYELIHFVRSIFLDAGLHYALREEVFEKSFEECYARKLQPLLTRQTRSDLNELGKSAAIEVFAKNLKQLLLMSPLKGERILGIDPGFINGCKLAVISEMAEVLETHVIYPHTRNTDPEKCGEELIKLLLRHNCKVIALGNGTACRETEHWLTKLFQIGLLDARNVRYSIVSEQGASVYSVSDVARKEFPNMDANEISAVSIARRLNDPLSEYVKIEPRHIGVGMYQHDIDEKQLNASLNDVVSECVSYVGVDLNTASLSVLKHVAGLTEKKADKIIEYRMEHGPFNTRKDLLNVKSIGEKTFVQCAGFVRIEPRSVGGKLANWLDCTWVHPESYTVATKIITKCGLLLKDIGQPEFITRITSFIERNNINDLALEFQIPQERLEIVLLALQRELNQDYRLDFNLRPLFKHGVIKLSELSVGEVVSGSVNNVTHFGAFIDIGVEHFGLIHTSKMENVTLAIGDRVVASVIEIDIKRRRIGLKLEPQIAETDTSFKLN